MLRSMDLLYIATVLVCIWTQGWSFSFGGTIGTCTYLYPVHHAHPQTSDSPYNFTVNATSYSPGDVIQLRFTSPADYYYNGLQASVRRLQGDTEELVGSFQDLPQDMKTMSWYPKVPADGNCLSHNSPIKRTETVVNWRAPEQSVGDVIIYASLTHDFDTFWVMKNKMTLRANLPSQDQPFMSEPTSGYQTVEWDKCGVSHGCLLYPRSCAGPNCRYIVTYLINDTMGTADIEMFGDAPGGYLSIGFSPNDKIMGNDDVYFCIQTDSQNRVEHAYNPSYYADKQRITNITNIMVGRDGDNIYCRFTRPLVQNLHIDDDVITYDMRDETYLMVAWGNVLYDSGGFPGYHPELPIVSDGPVDYYQAIIVNGRTLGTPLIIHASFGIISRMGIAGMAIIIARHFRFPLRKRVCGQSLWMQLHIGINIVTSILMAVTTIMLAPLLETWTKYASAHAILGVVLTVGMVALVINGYLAPKRSSSWRKCFDWSHRILGVLVFFLSVVCCILGFDVSLIERTLRWREIVIHVAWLLFHVLWDIIFELLGCQRERQKEAAKRAAQQAKVSESRTDLVIDDGNRKSAKKRSYTIEYSLLAIYITINILFTILSLFYLCTA